VPRRVRTIPSSDVDLARDAEAALAAIDGKVHVDDVAFALAGSLRSQYPAVVVHRQEPMARMADCDVWYAYRDGRKRRQR
jgi:hypothetical protein